MKDNKKIYGKLNKFGELVISPEIINDGFNLIINPQSEQLAHYGYKEIIYDDKPEYNYAFESLELKYEEKEDYIRAYYIIIPNIANVIDDNNENIDILNDII